MTGGELRSNGGVSSATGQYYSLGGGSSINVLSFAQPGADLRPHQHPRRQPRRRLALQCRRRRPGHRPPRHRRDHPTNGTWGIDQVRRRHHGARPSATNGYTGVTTVAGGTLAVDGTNGDGTIRGNITVATGATLAPRRRQPHHQHLARQHLPRRHLRPQREERCHRRGQRNPGDITGGGTLTLDLVNGTTTTFSGSITGGSFGVRGYNDDGSGAKQVLDRYRHRAGVASSSAATAPTMSPPSNWPDTARPRRIVGSRRNGWRPGHGDAEHHRRPHPDFDRQLLPRRAERASRHCEPGWHQRSQRHRTDPRRPLPNETSTYNLSGGTLNSNGGLYVGWDGTGLMNVSGAGRRQRDRRRLH